MHVEILYQPGHALARVHLAPHEAVTAESGAMVGMSPNLQMSTQSGGLLSGVKRLFGGESFFRNTFTAPSERGEFLLAHALCGDMRVLELTQAGYLLQSAAFIASTPNVAIETKVGGIRGFFSGAGLFVLRATAPSPGLLLVGAFGGIQELYCDGNVIIDTGHLVAWDATLEYSLGKSGSGWLASFLSGEGLACHFRGHGRIWIQSRSPVAYGRARLPLTLPQAVEQKAVRMRYEILQKPDFAAVRVAFDQPGEELVVESAAMLARDSAVQMQTKLQGGLFAAAKRKLLGGESLFTNRFTATGPGQTLWIAPAAEGDVQLVEMDGRVPLFLASGAFLAAAPSVTLDTQWQGARGFFTGAGLFLLAATGIGPLFFAAYGGIHAVDVGAEGYVCDTGHVVGFTAGLSYRVTKLGGIKSLFFSGEGLVCHFSGHGRLWLSTRNPGSLVSFLHPFRRAGSD